MKLLAVVLTTICLGLSVQCARATQKNQQVKSHNHNGRVHSHILPAAGVKHFHKHSHNGRTHVHPYSKKVGFKHSHNLSPRAKAWANAVKHVHEGRTHSHPLPISGIKHQHPHKHGGRSHKHPLPASGEKHFHRINNKKANVIKTSKSVNSSLNDKLVKAPVIRGASIKQQMTAVLNSSPRPRVNQSNKLPVEKSISNNTSIVNQRTINKVLGKKELITHRHDGRTHRHALPVTGIKHAHKHAHAGRIHSHLIPISNKPHQHKLMALQTKNNKYRAQENALVTKINNNALKKKNKKQSNPKRVITRKKQVINRVKPHRRSTKQTPQQIAAGNRQFSLALRYENGTGVKKNLPQAVNWYLRAAKQGNAKAQFNLASLYENGEGVTRNIPEAMRWYTTAAENGDVNAQLNLGNRYAKGRHVPKNIQEAAKWYKRAADQGDMRGRANLNYLVEDNNGAIKR